MSSFNSSVVQPSSILGFGAALTMLDDEREIAQVLSESLEAVLPSELAAVALYDDGPDTASSSRTGDDIVLVGQLTNDTLTERAVQELCHMAAQHRHATRTAPQAERSLTIDDTYPALDALGLHTCTLIRLGTVEHEFGVVIVGSTEPSPLASEHVTAVQMLDAQASLALHRIQVESEREAKAKALRESEQALRRARDELEERVAQRTAALRKTNAELRSEIAERRAAETIKARQFAAMEAAMVGISIHDPDGTFRYANPSHAEIYGYDDASALIGESWEILYDEEEIQFINQNVIPRISEGQRWSGELVGQKKSGEPFDVHLSLAPLDDGGLACICQDITERKASKQALRRYADRLEALRDIDQAILAAESPEEIASEVIERAQRIIPFKSATVTVIDWDAGTAHVLATCENNPLDTPRTLSLDNVYLNEGLRKGETEVLSDADYEAVPEAKQRIYTMGLHSVLCLPMVVEGDVIGVMHMGRTEPDAFTDEDWTIGRELADHMAVALRQSQLLNKVQKQRERLEERVQERTEELESFTYSVSHDLRSPLRAVDGFARMLIDTRADQLDEEGKRMLNVIYENTQKMGQLIDDLLALSRLGRREMRRCPVDMETLAQEVFDELMRNAPDRTVTFEQEPLPDAYADRAMMRRVLENLLSNALKFTSDVEAPRIEMGADDAGGDTVYYVNDNGAGFDAEYADKMFGVFERLHDEDEFSGTGVGLAIVERVLRRHNGQAWAEGDVGDGATFYFCVSCSAAPDHATSTASAS
jgi:PAS domain S-box-containing protein